MEVLLSVFIFLLGLCVGSFLNVLIYRLPRSLSPFKGRSFCLACKKKILWQDNIPVLSFILLRGRCRFCHSPISFQYPLVELATGALFALIFFYFYPHFFLIGYYLILISSLIVIFFIDLRYQIIPDKIVLPMIILSLPYVWYSVSYPFLSALGASSFFFLLYLVTKKKGMGLGDVKLVALMGLALGFPRIILAFYLAFLTGAIVGVILLLIGKKRLGEQIAFGPFLVASTILTIFLGRDLISWFTARFF